MVWARYISHKGYVLKLGRQCGAGGVAMWKVLCHWVSSWEGINEHLKQQAVLIRKV
jgi:hypothetical protein